MPEVKVALSVTPAKAGVQGFWSYVPDAYLMDSWSSPFAVIPVEVFISPIRPISPIMMWCRPGTSALSDSNLVFGEITSVVEARDDMLFFKLREFPDNLLY